MSGQEDSLKEEILHLYGEPLIGATYTNTYGEENIANLVKKYRALDADGMQAMLNLVVEFSQSPELSLSFVSVGVLHAIGMRQEVEAAYRWAGDQEDEKAIVSHFDIGKSLAEYFVRE